MQARSLSKTAGSSLLQGHFLSLCHLSLQFHYFCCVFEFDSKFRSDGHLLFVVLIDELVEILIGQFLHE